MKILAIETTGANASAALIDEGGNIYQKISEEKMSHLQSLIPMIDMLLSKRKLSIDDVTHVAVSRGPGSFTGIRIGMATGKALAQALNIPAVGVPTLKSFCWNVPGFNGLVCPVLDARREQVYGGVYSYNEGSCIELIKENAWYISDYLLEIERLTLYRGEKVLFFGDGINVYGDLLKQWAITTDRLLAKDDISGIAAESGVRYQRAASVAMEALKMIRAGKMGSFNSLIPIYLRKAEAERKLEQRQKSGGSLK